MTYGDTDLALGATATSGLAVSYASATPDVCTIVAGKLHVVAAGSCTITASQAGNTTYNPAPDVRQTFAIAKAALTVTAPDRTITYGQATPTFGVTYAGFVGSDSAASLGGSLAYTLEGIAPTVYTASTTPPTHAGSYSITPSGLTSANYAISYVAGTYTISPASVNTMLTWAGSIAPNPAVVGQQVSFPGLLVKETGSPTGDTSLRVTLRSWDNAGCSGGFIDRDTQSIDAAGHVTLHFTPSAVGSYRFTLVFSGQTSGDTYYAQASSVCNAMTVNPAKLDQTISFTAPTGVAYGDADVALGATATSNLAVSYASSTPTVCTIVSGKLHVVAAGSCTITASQAGNTTYNPAPDVRQTFAIAKAALTVTAPDRTITYGQATPTFGVTYAGFVGSDSAASLGGSLAYTLEGIAPTVYTASTTPPTHAGSYSITPSGLTSANYAISYVAGTYTISPALVSIVIGNTSQTYDGTPKAVTVKVTPTASHTITYAGWDGTSYGPSTSAPRDVGTYRVTVVITDPDYTADDEYGYLTIAKRDQSITFGALAGRTYGDAAFGVTASAGSGLPVTFTASGDCTVDADGDPVTITAAGSCTITAAQAGNANWNAAPAVPQTFAIAKRDQSITFGALAGRTYGDAAFGVTASAGSGLPVTFTASGDCTVDADGDPVTITAAGSCTITAAQAGNANWNAAPAVPQTFAIAKRDQSITFGALAGRTYGDAAFGVTASAGSGLPVTFTASGDCTVDADGDPVTITAAGSCTITAAQAGNANWNAASRVERTFTIAKGDQAITFTAPSGVSFDLPDFDLGATASSGLPVSYASSTSAVCTIKDGKLHVVAAGTCKVTASQDGNNNWNEALDVEQTFTIAKGDQAITFTAPSGVSFDLPDFDLGATASSGLPVSYASSTSAVCTIKDGKLHIVATGSCTIKASQAGNGNWNAASDVPQTFAIAKADQEITFGSLADKTFGDAPFKVSATATSTLPVAFTASGDCTVDDDGDQVTITGAGSCTIKASQAGNDNWKAATPVERKFAIAKAAATAVYTGPTYQLLTSVPSTRVTLSADVSPAICAGDLSFRVASNDGTVIPTDGGTVTLLAGLYWVEAIVNGEDCTGGHDEATISIVSAGDKSNGGGWYKVEAHTGSPRVNFGYTVQSTTTKDKKTGIVTTTYKGQLIWLNNEQWRLKGAISGETVTVADETTGTAPYGTFDCPTNFASTLPATTSGSGCGSVTGTGVLQRWDASALSWVESAHGSVTFTATMYDGGQAKVCKTTGKKTTCTTVDNPDWFGIQFDGVSGDDVRESDPIQLMGGALRVK